MDEHTEALSPLDEWAVRLFEPERVTAVEFEPLDDQSPSPN